MENRLKDKVVKSRSKLKGKKRFDINEDLTSFNLDLHRKARLAKHVYHAWATDGKIFVKLHDESIQLLRCPADILALSSD